MFFVDKSKKPLWCQVCDKEDILQGQVAEKQGFDGKKEKKHLHILKVQMKLNKRFGSVFQVLVITLKKGH